MLQDGSSRSCMLFTPFGYSDESFGGVATTRFPGRQRKRLCLEKELRVVKGFFVDGARVFKNLVEFFFFFPLHVGRKTKNKKRISRKNCDSVSFYPCLLLFFVIGRRFILLLYSVSERMTD